MLLETVVPGRGFSESIRDIRMELQLGHAEPILAAAYSLDGKLALTGSNGLVTLWDLETMRQIRQMYGHWPGPMSLGFPVTLADATHPPRQGGERFAPVSLTSGQGLRIVVANVRIPGAGEVTDACPFIVRFFGADGSLIGAEQDLSLAPGASMAVTAVGATGLVRAIVSLPNFADPSRICALRNTMEVFNASTSTTLFLVPGEGCLGEVLCGAPLAKTPKD